MIGRRYLLKGAVASLLSAAGCSKKVPASCVDAPGLAPEAAQIRSTLGYVEPSPDPEKRCDSCRQYVAPRDEGSCGSCNVLKGPIHPSGTCKVYGARG